jgi:protein-S-isoprenylcysteine O-methyltransferase Ste14
MFEALPLLQPPRYTLRMPGDFFMIAVGLWAAWFVSWHIAMAWRGKPTASAPRRDYRLYFVMIALGFFLLFNAVPRLAAPVLWPVTPPLGWSMEALTLAGILFAWWARVHLGKLWSGGIERMADHRLVDTGPYALVRHPIYTGLIAAAAAMAVIRATPWALLGLVLFALGFALKARVEERFLESEIGGYDSYRARVPMIVPFIR